MQYGFVIDHHRCIGCHACTVACKAENDVPVGDFRTWVKYTEIGTFPQVRRHFAVLRCNHCTSAPCVTICPVNALEKRPDGIVDLDRDVCIGCKACMQACPYDALYLNEDQGCAEKCHYCAHRVEQGLEPACVIVCPEQAIVAGDLHDPDSKVAQLARRQEAQARRVEQGTGPNVFYLGVDPVSLEPGTAKEPPMWLWSDRRYVPPDWPADQPLYPDATTVLDVDHAVHWGWKVSSYLVTKGIAAGAALLAPLAGWLGAGTIGGDYAPELLALFWLTVTTALLVLDLKRPAKFLTLLTRGNRRSWLVRGAYVLMAFGAVTTGALLLRWIGAPGNTFERLIGGGSADLLRWMNLVPAALAAGYTAFLFAQCEGRDLWQNQRTLLPHLIVQALFLGGLFLLPFVPHWSLGIVVGIMALAHLAFAEHDLRGPHRTSNARQAAALLPRVTLLASGGPPARVVAHALVIAAAVLAIPALWVGPFALGAVAAVGAVGMYAWEHAFVRAGQLPPLS